jgi:hypothetical protein
MTFQVVTLLLTNKYTCTYGQVQTGRALPLTSEPGVQMAPVPQGFGSHSDPLLPLPGAILWEALGRQSTRGSPPVPRNHKMSAG